MNKRRYLQSSHVQISSFLPLWMRNDSKTQRGEHVPERAKFWPAHPRKTATFPLSLLFLGGDAFLWTMLWFPDAILYADTFLTTSLPLSLPVCLHLLTQHAHSFCLQGSWQQNWKKSWIQEMVRSFGPENNRGPTMNPSSSWVWLTLAFFHTYLW